MTETPERPELLPCPFCGWQITDDDVINENGRDGEATGDVGGIEYWRARCIECGGMCDGAENRSEAVANWNRRASSLGEPVSQEAPIPFSAMPSYLLHCDAQDVGQLAETRFKSRDRISVMLNEDWRRLCAALSGGIPRTDSAPSVISSASPLSEEERGTIKRARQRVSNGEEEYSRHLVASLLETIARLSASAPSPEDKGSDNG